MKSDWIRYWFLVFAALFVAGNAAAAVRACMVGPGGHESATSQLRDAGGDQSLCPNPDDAPRCFAHCTQTQSVSNDAQSIASDASRLVPIVQAGVTRLPRMQARLLAVAPAPPAAGPPLTILFHNLRI